MTLYRDIVRDIKAQIETDVLTNGSRLPSIMALCRVYGVSSSTVRLALTDLVTEGMVRSHPGSGYFVKAPNRAAGLLTGDGTIAIIVPSSDNSFYSDVVRGAQAACRQRGFHLVIYYSSDDPDVEAEELRELADKVAGLVIAPTANDRNHLRYAALMQRGVHFVFVDCYVDGLDVPLVATDNETGGYLATRHLLEIGRNRIFAISERHHTSLEERLTGYRKALREFKVDFDPTLIRKSEAMNEEAGYMLTKELIERNGITEPVGLFAGHDAIARGCYMAIKNANLRIPEDIAIVGFDDYYALYLDPQLTTVRQDPFGIGSEGIRVLSDMIRPGVKPVPRTIRLDPEIVVRGSTVAEKSPRVADFTDRTRYRKRKIESLTTGLLRVG